MTLEWNVPLRHPKMHSRTKFEIPTSKNIGDMHHSMPILGQRSVTQGRHATLRHPKMHAHTEFGISTSNNEICSVKEYSKS